MKAKTCKKTLLVDFFILSTVYDTTKVWEIMLNKFQFVLDWLWLMDLTARQDDT